MTEQEKQNEKWLEFDRRMTALENGIEKHNTIIDGMRSWMKIQELTNKQVIEGLKQVIH